MKIEKEFAPVTIKIETREEWEQLLAILNYAIDSPNNYINEHAYSLRKMIKES